MKKKITLAFVLGFILVASPWKMGALLVETLVMSPGPTRVSDGTDQYWEVRSLQSKLAFLGYEVTYAPNLNFEGMRVYGLTIPSERKIYVESNLKWNARYAILAHEAGHAMAQGQYDENEGEVFAEAVATLVSHNGIREHARYLSRLKATTLLILLIEWPSVYRAAATLEG